MTASPKRTSRRGHSSRRDRESVASLVAGATTALTLTVAFGAMALGVEDFWLAFVVGFGVVMPVALGIVNDRWPADGDSNQAETDTQSPLEELQMRYARGELSDAEFERRVGRLLENEPEENPRSAPEENGR
jgi:uncharacterized membrane protein